jgi:hypothetical protein
MSINGNLSSHSILQNVFYITWNFGFSAKAKEYYSEKNCMNPKSVIVSRNVPIELTSIHGNWCNFTRNIVGPEPGPVEMPGLKHAYCGVCRMQQSDAC